MLCASSSDACRKNLESAEKTIAEYNAKVEAENKAEEERILGVAGLICTPTEAYISNVSVAEEARRRGIAAGLLKALLSEGRKRGIRDFTLEVRASNAAAIALYEGLGFVCEGRRKAFYSAPREDALIYWLREG